MLGADVTTVVLAGVPNPMPNGLGTGDVVVPNIPVLGVEVVAVVVVVVVLVPLPNGLGVGVVVVALPKSGPVLVIVAVVPNGTLDEVVDDKLSGISECWS